MTAFTKEVDCPVDEKPFNSGESLWRPTVEAEYRDVDGQKVLFIATYDEKIQLNEAAECGFLKWEDSIKNGVFVDNFPCHRCRQIIGFRRA